MSDEVIRGPSAAGICFDPLAFEIGPPPPFRIEWFHDENRVRWKVIVEDRVAARLLNDDAAKRRVQAWRERRADEVPA